MSIQATLPRKNDQPNPPSGKARNGAGSMPVIENLRVALMGLAANKMRAALTMLGIIIGVAAVIAMISLGQGAREKTLSQIKAMGTNLLLIEPERSRIGAVRGAAGSWNRLKLTDIEAITPDTCPDVANVSPEIQTDTQIKAGSENTNTRVFGVWPSWVDIRNYELRYGRNFTADENKKRAKVVILGNDVYQNLFPQGGDPTGTMIRINGVGVNVIGVFKPKGNSGNNNNDEMVAVPALTAQKRLFNFWQGRIRSFSAQAVSEEKMGAAAEQIDALFRKRYKVKPDAPSTIVIKNQSEIASFAEESQNTFTALLAGIAGVSLLVGGIGIMNIMLVSVTERTREIGVRKAIGAKRRDILLQFLIEAVTLSVLGGIVGILLGVTIALTLPVFLQDTSTVLSVGPMLLAFAFSAGVGIFFGFYPAQKASKLDPIVALRYE
ncbi:MAG: ABC transporter permease [Capsulimonadales bacterium]|nr:ABC transporter permease [Capsulimonadales bacterium]